MAGRKQHFIPQHVLRRFSRSGSGRQPQVWVHTHDGRKFSSSTEGVAAQREFYSKLSPGEITLDDLITGHESALVPLLDVMASLEPGSTVDAHEAAEVIAHLIIRPAYVRDAFLSAMDELMEGLEVRFSDPAAMAEMFKVHQNPPGRLLRNTLNEFWTEHKTDLQRRGLTKDAAQRWMLSELRRRGPDLLQGSTPVVKMFFAIYRERRKALVKEAHVRALGQTLAPEKRVERLRELSWTIHADTEDGSVLPDCIATAVLDDGGCLPLFFADSDKVRTVTMPLGSGSLLVGTRSGMVPAAATSEMAISCAWDFFVAADDLPGFDRLASCIGARTRPYLRQLVQEGVSGVRLSG